MKPAPRVGAAKARRPAAIRSLDRSYTLNGKRPTRRPVRRRGSTRRNQALLLKAPIGVMPLYGTCPPCEKPRQCCPRRC